MMSEGKGLLNRYVAVKLKVCFTKVMQVRTMESISKRKQWSDEDSLAAMEREEKALCIYLIDVSSACIHMPSYYRQHLYYANYRHLVIVVNIRVILTLHM